MILIVFLGFFVMSFAYAEPGIMFPEGKIKGTSPGDSAVIFPAQQFDGITPERHVEGYFCDSHRTELTEEAIENILSKLQIRGFSQN